MVPVLQTRFARLASIPAEQYVLFCLFFVQFTAWDGLDLTNAVNDALGLSLP